MTEHHAVRSTSEHHVVIVGAGFGGLAAARALTKDTSQIRVTLIDKRNHHTFQPLLYQVATAGLDAGDVCYPTRRFARGNDALTSLQGEVTGIDFDAQTISLADNSTVDYDSLILAMGGVTADFGVPGVTDHAFGLKSAAEADALRSHVISQFETEANRRGRGAEADHAPTTIVVVGGGPTGVEMAGGYAELTSRVLLPDYPELDPAIVRVILVEGRDALLAGFAPKLQANAVRTLEKMGVEVMLNTQVAEVGASSVTFADGSSVDTATVVWAAGIRAHPLAEQLGLDVDRAGRVAIDDQLRLPGKPNVYAIGDLAAIPYEDGLAPQVAPVAIQGGEHVAERIIESMSGIDTAAPPFAYFDKGSMATIGRNAAVVELPNGWTISGFPGWVVWLGLHLIMLMGFRNRASVFVNWAWNYLTYDRGSRAVIEPTHRPELDSRG